MLALPLYDDARTVEVWVNTTSTTANQAVAAYGQASTDDAFIISVSPQAIAVIAAIGCSASFFTPIAHPVNILMIGPANYKFSDFFHLGWRLTIICFVMLMIGMVLFWHLGI